MVTKSKKQAIDKFDLITSQICELLEKGTKPWEKPWFGVRPRNLISSYIYQGYNPLLCSLSMLTYDYSSPYFVGRCQAFDLNWRMIKGSKATWIRKGGNGVREVELEDGTKKQEFVGHCQWDGIYNIACWDDSESDIKIASLVSQIEPQTTINADHRIEAIEAFVAKQEPRVTNGGDSACYSPQVDAVMLPKFTAFTSVEKYYATLIHELVHGTGHPTRLNRDLTGAFGSAKYANEELIAELAAAFVCNELGITSQIEHHASYIDSWLQALKGDKNYFFTAARDARKAADYLLQKAGLLQVEIQ